ncbi:inositol-pentakisphosphate 2-kinase [Cubamyces menziesii]|nr:inositol-pentakisphosphate 2-kinase [Cubamyces menziesii]
MRYSSPCNSPYLSTLNSTNTIPTRLRDANMESSMSHSDTPRIEHTSPRDWKYISEGGSTIVFSYAGPSHPQFDGTALRLRKRPVSAAAPTQGVPHGYETQQSSENQADGDTSEKAEKEEEADEPDDPTIVFQRTVIERLVPRAHLPRLDAVHVARAWLAELAALTEPLRPPERRAADAIDTDRRKAVLATNLVGGEGWAVEIKPKWGFLPAPTLLSPATRPIKTRTCRFCMHAHLRRTTQSEGASNDNDGEDSYCPLDLFADDPARARRALHALWGAWIASGGTVNNLRVFVRGKMVKPNAADPASLAPLAEQLFHGPQVPAPSEDRASTTAADALRDAFTSAVQPLLQHTPVLRTLARLQRMLDALDVEGLAALWARRRGADVPLGHGEPDPDVAEWAAFVDAYLARRRTEEEGEEEGEEGGEDSEAELRYRILAYLLSASFKDCSIILRLPPRSQSQPQPEGAPAGTVTVIDLDVKRIGRLAKWAALDAEIVDAYRGVAQPRVCVDAGHGVRAGD